MYHRWSILIAAFDWNEGNVGKCTKHGVSVAEIEFVLTHPLLLRDDSVHSKTEKRQQAVGRTREGRHVFVAFTIRERHGKFHIRPISARYMHSKEVRRYEEDAP